MLIGEVTAGPVDLLLLTKTGGIYRWPSCTQVRRTESELRWTNRRGEKRSMALAFLESWEISEATIIVRELA